MAEFKIICPTCSSNDCSVEPKMSDDLGVFEGVFIVCNSCGEKEHVY